MRVDVLAAGHLGRVTVRDEREEDEIGDDPFKKCAVSQASTSLRLLMNRAQWFSPIAE
jgi:hypothetical protein